MADVKRVLAIDVDDKAFQKFLADYNKWSASLNQLTTQWQKLAAAMRGTHVPGMPAIVNQHAQVHHHAKHTHNWWEKTKHHVKEIGKEMFRWLGIGSVVGSLFGLGGFMSFMRLGERMTAQRKMSVGLGAAQGRVEAFQIAYGQYYQDPQSLLRNVAGAKADVTSPSHRALSTFLGVDISGMDAVEIGARLTRRMRDYFGNVPERNWTPMLGAFGLSDLGIGHENIRAALKDDPGYAEKNLAELSGKFKISDQATLGWTKFSHALEAAATQITNVLGTGLAPLAEPLGKVATAFTDILAAGLGHPALKGNIEAFAKWLKEQAAWLGSPEGQKAIKQAFSDAVDAVKSFTGVVMGFIRIVGRFLSVGEKLGGVVAKGAANTGLGQAYMLGRYIYEWSQKNPGTSKEEFEQMWNNLKFDLGPDTQKRQHGGPITAGQPYTVGEAGAERIVPARGGYVIPADFTHALVDTESSGNYRAVNKVTGAAGKYQIMPFNIGPWSRAALGRSLSLSEFLSNPAAQDAIYQHRMGLYFSQYGTVEDALSMWHSGMPYAKAVGRGARDVNMSTADYVAKTMAKMRGVAQRFGAGGGFAGKGIFADARGSADASSGYLPGTYHHMVDQLVRQNITQAGLTLDIHPMPGAPITVSTSMVGRRLAL